MTKILLTPDYTGYIQELDKLDFRVRSGLILYKGLPMWHTEASELSEYNFYLIDESDEPYGIISILCIDDLGDHYYYGKFSSRDQALDWLENPFPLY